MGTIMTQNTASQRLEAASRILQRAKEDMNQTDIPAHLIVKMKSHVEAWTAEVKRLEFLVAHGG